MWNLPPQNSRVIFDSLKAFEKQTIMTIFHHRAMKNVRYFYNKYIQHTSPYLRRSLTFASILLLPLVLSVYSVKDPEQQVSSSMQLIRDCLMNTIETSHFSIWHSLSLGLFYRVAVLVRFTHDFVCSLARLFLVIIINICDVYIWSNFNFSMPRTSHVGVLVYM